MNIDFIVIVMFYCEGLLVYVMLRSYLFVCNCVCEWGIDVQMLFLFDNVDYEIVEVVCNYFDFVGDELILDILVGDCGLVCNIGVSYLLGIYVCIFDGDDLISCDYFQWYVEYVCSVLDFMILYVELVVSFGGIEYYSYQFNLVIMLFFNDLLMVVNLWISVIFV